MIPNQWYVVLDSDQVRAGRPIGVTRLGERLVFWRDQAGRVACLRDQCVHRGAALSAGRTLGDHIQCPFHGLEYDATGRCRFIPCNGKSAAVPEQFRVAGYPTREAHGYIYIWWGEARAELPEPPFFEDIDSSFVYGRVYDPWATHYSRAIENQLDVAHLPFVHYNTIGRGNRTLVDGPLARIDDKGITVWTHNRIDDGSRALRADELPEPHVQFRIEYLFPNLWQNHITESTRIVIAFVPVDDEHTILYLRYYQNNVRVSLLGRLVSQLGARASLIIAHQDRRVVVTQQPKPSALRSGEKLVQADGPILMYRRRRQELIDAARHSAGS
jgi:phenylpropionate dioxygenase-like ring-hydroxylating dioxygenase large terminal subunit